MNFLKMLNKAVSQIFCFKVKQTTLEETFKVELKMIYFHIFQFPTTEWGEGAVICLFLAPSGWDLTMLGPILYLL